MIRRDILGRFAKTINWELCIGIGLLGGIVLGILIDIKSQPIVIINEVEAKEVEESIYPREVKIEAVIDWTPDRIEKEIRDTFPEDPDTAVKIAKCESGLNADIQSYHYNNGHREQSFGIFQIHSPSWDKKAQKLDLEDYRTDVADNIKMARYIYDNAGRKWTDWSCYTKKMI